jgi:uncharacterized protein
MTTILMSVTASSLLTLPIVDPMMREFLNRALARADKAHSYDHALRVFENALNILHAEGRTLTQLEMVEVKVATLCHDVLDHKLVAAGQTLPADEVKTFYKKYFATYLAEHHHAQADIDAEADHYVQKICHIHDNCSWSKRHTAIPLENADWMRKLVQDADWLDAIGDIGLNRCIEYTCAIYPAADDEQTQIISRLVCDHIREKLLLIPDALHFQSSRLLAAAATLPLTKFLERYDKQE